MKECAIRLYQAATDLAGIAANAVTVAALLGESPQTLRNWEHRGVSKSGAIRAQERIGCSATWLTTGLGPMQERLPDAPTAGTTHAQAVLRTLCNLAHRNALTDHDWTMILQLAERMAPPAT